MLESLKKQTYLPYEVIVVDDFSLDKTAEIAKSYGVKVLKNTEPPEEWTGKTPF
ncbi:glycosyltransferase [Thermoanaerobacterium thermosaccharolyticum]|uniref:glycosyltransferase n=1 Tax=Thermoanaerobacterium thermosaccharolyticum TaxID=1517 RepID=UPI0009DAA248|nr:glycosyltransferase [Thermoanaerobacterium thermosaccharolyticum]